MTQPLQLSMGIDAPHNNQYLFSDHYLDHLLPGDSRWAEALPQAEGFLAWLRVLYMQEKDHLPHYSEAQLEEHWIKPILAQLGHVYEPQAVIPGLQSSARRPDYVFFATDADRQAAVSSQNTADYAARALAVGDAKKWGIALGKKQQGGNDSFEYQNPSYQIDYYLRSADLTWGILTNGQKWRLVHRETSYRLATYYEIDLPGLLARAEAGPLRYFTLFFRQAAFTPDAQGRRYLADALAASRAYAVALEEDLRENVYRALEKLLQGFLDLPANGLTTADLPEIYQNSLILLYRFIFILYGESRGLLPMHTEVYRDQYSLHRIKRQFADLQQQDRLPAPMTSIHWGDIRQLFQIINGDNADLNRYLGVPRYNGGLFDPAQHPFLAQKAVGDRALVEAINLLSLRRSEAGQLEFVDYRTLGVRQLGSVYEGLLEYQPRAAAAPMVAIREGKNKEGRWVAQAQAPKNANILEERAAGQVYLETDRGERKATGSYYTPQYIVEYIVDNTLGPLVEAARQRVKARAKDAPSQAAAVAAEQSFVEEILSLKTLDPAMGSGHFLVEATEYLARALATDPYVTTDESPTEEDLTIWKRRVVERCIYGVDKNPLAVELAKLSLWLTTVAADKPLSFLDHHLKCGDALVGARVADLGEAPPLLLTKKQRQQREKLAALGMRQANLFEQRLAEKLPVMLGKVLEITQTESDSYDTVHAKEAADKAVADLKAPFEAVANLWVSAWFGQTYNQGDYDAALNKLHTPADLLALPAVQQAQAITAERRFFHWELAFPEVFYNAHGQPLGDKAGFDAVVGNPPYARIQRLGKPDINYFSSKFESATGNYDIYVLFVEAGVSNLNEKGQFGYILPNKFFRVDYGVGLRKFIAAGKHIRQIVDFGSNQVFVDSATTYTALLFLTGSSNLEQFAYWKLADNSDPKIPEQHLSEENWTVVSFEHSAISEDVWNFHIDSGAKILNKLDEQGQKLKELTVSIGRGSSTGNDDLFCLEIIQDQGDVAIVKSNVVAEPFTIERECLRSPIHATDFGKYSFSTTNYKKGLIWPYSQDYNLLSEAEFSALFPRAWRYLTQHAELLKERAQYSSWYGYSAPRNLEVHDQGQLLIPLLAGGPIFSIYPQPQPNYALMASGGFSITLPKGTPYNHLYVLSVINNPALFFYLKSISNVFRGGWVTCTKQYFEQLPIRRISFTTPAEERAQLVAQAQTLYQSGEIAPLLAFTAARLAAQPEQSDVVHDLLAHLAGQMIDLNRQKQQLTETFWLDLEGVTDEATFPKLRDKGKQEATLAKAAALAPFVDANSHSSRRLDESLAWDEAAFKAFIKALAGSVSGLSALVQVYRQHAPTYRQLVTTLAATDRLIDQIVYQLYGLTDDEIAIVEGQG